ncbi:MAG: hypothetical protein J7456_11845 [Chloroflexus sp.]|jgi:hypothetical protein|nr:hypothetical protein [Chloroflexus sp.]MBO9316459.1 hypothetical protein [Chloroflexus sp.]MBO9319746.1 hypothetical protein [Chloroflexus sp.]MBO9374822.1 hypothetical protein [Chloroflexus sp.]
MSEKEITIAKALMVLATEVEQPVSLSQLCDLINERWSTNYAKNSLRNHLRWNAPHVGWVRIHRNQYLSLPAALEGVRFRCWPKSAEIASGLLSVKHLVPFFYTDHTPLIYDEQGEMIQIVRNSKLFPWTASLHLQLQQWFKRHRFTEGDSILVEIRYRKSRNQIEQRLYLSYESAAAFQAQAVAAQDQEFIQAIVEQFDSLGGTATSVEAVVLPVIARAPWRTSYPGRPWQYLLEEDGRLSLDETGTLINEKVLQSLMTGRDVSRPAAQATASSAVSTPQDAALLKDIAELQQEIQRSREQDRRAGVWDGTLSRNSYMPDEDDEEYVLDADLFDLMNEDRKLHDLFAHISSRLREVLPPDVQQRLSNATPAEAETILSSQLNYLLVKAPDLFPKLDLTSHPFSIDVSTLNNRDVEFDLALDADDDEDDWDNDWDDDWDDEDDEDWDDEVQEVERDFALKEQALNRSQELMNLYFGYLQETGRKRSTALSYARPLQPYANFLATFYHRSLDAGDYATLDEFLFYYYPYHNDHVAKERVREMCHSLKNFYAFLKLRGLIEDDQFAQAIWQRRFQAERLMGYRKMIRSKFSDQLHLLQKLFAPYLS